MDGTFSPPEFMTMAFIGIYGGSETVSVIGMTREALEEFVTANEFKTHPRVLRLTITHRPDGEIIDMLKEP